MLKKLADSNVISSVAAFMLTFDAAVWFWGNLCATEQDTCPTKWQMNIRQKSINLPY
jgi:hypothetical protein